MIVNRKNGAVTVRYQDEDYMDGTATVKVANLPFGEVKEVRIKRVGREEMVLLLSDYDALALAAALVVSEVPPPPSSRRTKVDRKTVVKI